MMNFNKNTRLLDCTLRDGGYYNNWNFDKKLIQKYLNAMSFQKIDYIEIGFRSLFESKNNGITFKVTDKILNSFKLPKNMKIGVMVNAAEFLKDERSIINLCNKNFTFSKKSKEFLNNNGGYSLVKLFIKANEALIFDDEISRPMNIE